MSEQYEYNLDDLGYVSDAFNAYLRYIATFSPLPSEEIYKLGIRNMNGDKEARDKLILHHLAFVVYIAKPYFRYYPNMEPLDIVQYGNEGLMKAVSMYDPNEGALTTYAGDWIKQRIMRYLECDYADITTPVHIQEAIKKYNKIMNKVEFGLIDMPSDKELCEILKVSKEGLNSVKEGYSTTVVSMNKEVDEDGSELELFIEDEDADRPEDIISSIDNFDVLIALKNKLSPVRYYVLYMRYFDKKEHTLDELSAELGVTRERVRQHEEKAKEAARPILANEYARVQKIIREIKLKEKANFYKLNERPLSPKDIINYLYLRRYFSGIAKDLIYDIYIHPQKLTIKEAATKYSITEKEFKILLQKTKAHINEILLKKHDDYLSFANDMRNTYKTKIFEIDLEDNYAKYNPKEILKKYGSLTLDEIKGLYGSDFDNLPSDTKNLLNRFFSTPNYKIVDRVFMEREVNLSIFNCKNMSTKLASSVLYPTYLRYKNEFTLEQQFLLECYFFNKKDKKLYTTLSYTSSKKLLLHYALRKLEKYYFGLHKIFWYQTLSKEMYEEVLEKCGDAITDERKKILNLFYGVGCDAMSLQDIVATYNLDYIKTHDFLKHTRDYIYNLYFNRTSKKRIDKNIYCKYILNKAYELTSETREILKMHVLDDKTYDEISESTGLTKYRISNIVTEGIRKLDFYRFGIIRATIIDEGRLDDFFKKYKIDFYELEKEIIKLRFVEHLTVDDIYKALNSNIEDKPTKIKIKKVTKDFINKTNSRFTNAFNSYLVEEVTLTNEMLLELTNKRPLESVITEIEKRVISFSFGLKNYTNPSGKKFTKERILEIMGISNDQYHHFKHEGIKKLKMHVAGLIYPSDVYMPLDKLEIMVRDRHIPISDKERMIINSITGLNGCPHKSYKEVAKITGDTEGSIRRRYQRAIVSILKYENGELDARLDYGLDIAPNLKYFSKLDQKYIIEYFGHGLTYEAMSKKYKLSRDKISAIFDAIFARIQDILENPKAKRFDYDYADTVIDNPDLPFFGNREIVKSIYTMAFDNETMEKIPMTEIVKRLNLEIDARVANKLLIDFMISIGKYKMGIKRNSTFTHEQIKDFYDRNVDNLNKAKKKTYDIYFRKYAADGSRMATYVNDTIIYDLLKNSRDDCFKIYTATRDEVLKILRNKNYKINKRVRQSLMQIFNIPDRLLLNGQEINHVIRMLHLLDINLKRNMPREDVKQLKRDI